MKMADLPLREEGDLGDVIGYRIQTAFLSTPSARRATWDAP